MEAMLGISLYSYLYLKLAKMPHLSYYLLCFLFNKTGEEEGRRGQNRICLEVRGRGRGREGGWTVGRDGLNNVYTYE
jgi:hypothetical protein